MYSTRSVLILCLFFILFYVESVFTLHVDLERKSRALTESGSASRLGPVDAISGSVSTASLVSPTSSSSSTHSTSSSTPSRRPTKSRLSTSSRPSTKSRHRTKSMLSTQSGPSKTSSSFTTSKSSTTSRQHTKSRLSITSRSSTTSRSSIKSSSSSTSSTVSPFSTSSTSSSTKSNTSLTLSASSSTKPSLSLTSSSSSSTKSSSSLTSLTSSSTPSSTSSTSSSTLSSTSSTSSSTPSSTSSTSSSTSSSSSFTKSSSSSTSSTSSSISSSSSSTKSSSSSTFSTSSSISSSSSSTKSSSSLTSSTSSSTSSSSSSIKSSSSLTSSTSSSTLSSTSSTSSSTPSSTSSTSSSTPSSTSSTSSSTSSSSSSIKSSSSSTSSTSSSTPSSTSSTSSSTPSSTSPTSSSTPSSTSSTPSFTPSKTTLPITTEKHRTTYTVRHHHTVAVGIGAWVLGGIGGGVAAVGDFLFDIDEGDLDRIEEDDDGDPEVSTESQPTAKTTKTTSTSSTSSTTSSTPTSTQYLILPQDGLTLKQQEDLLDNLRQLSLKPIESTLRNNGSAYWWLATLTVGNAAAVSENPAVMLCFPDKTFVPDTQAPTKPKTPPQKFQQRSTPLNDIVEDDWTPDDFVRYPTDDLPLQQLSTPETWLWNTGTYDSFHTGGSGITVFVVDSGANKYNPEYISLGGRVRWLENVEPWMSDDDSYNHGTCVLSKVAGATYGSAKAADIIVVKIATTIWKLSWMCDGFAKVLNEVKSKRMQGKAVVNVSFGSPGRIQDEFDEMEIFTMWRLIKELIDNDVVIVVASGNYPGIDDDVTEIPQRLAYPQTLQHVRRTLPALPIILVGSVVERGVRSRWSQGTTILTISARGDGMCASGEHPGPDSEPRDGTSFSAPLVSGLVAQILAAPAFYSYPRSPLAPGQTQLEMKAYIENLGYPKNDPNLMISAWNGVNVKCGPRSPQGPPPPPPRGSKLKVRQAVEPAACPAQTITTTTSVLDTVTSISTEALTTILTTVVVVTVTITSTITTTIITSTTTVWVPSACGCSCLSAGDDSDYCSTCEGEAVFSNFVAARGVLMQPSPILTSMPTPSSSSSSSSSTLTGVLIPSSPGSINTSLSTVTDVVTETLDTTITSIDSEIVTSTVTQMSTITTTSTSTSTTNIVSMSCTVCDPGVC